MTPSAIRHPLFLNLGEASVCLQCPDQAFAEIACEHLFLSTSHEGSLLSTIQYVVDDSVEDILTFERKENVVYIDRHTAADGHETIVLGMFDRFTAVLELYPSEILVRFGRQAPVQILLDDVLQAALQPILEELGGFILHGACMVRNNRAIVLMGNSGAGKSTTAFNMTRYGFSGYSDDAVLVTPKQEELMVWPLTRQLSLRPLSFNLFEKQGILLDHYQKVGDKYYFSQTAPNLNGAKLEHLCFLDLSGEALTHIEHLTQARTLEILNASNRHFSFMGRDDASAFAHSLAKAVPVPLLVRLGTNLDYQGTLFDKLLSDRGPELRPYSLSKAKVPTRSLKAGLIRQAWTCPNREPLKELIPLLSDFDPVIFKLALGFFQTYPLSTIKVLDAPTGNRGDDSIDPVPWIRAADWFAGCQGLLKLSSDKVIQKFAYSWLKSAPMLYPFLKESIEEDTKTSILLEKAWHRCRAEDYPGIGAPGNCIHLLNFHDTSIWAIPEDDDRWQNRFFKHPSPVRLFLWIDEAASVDGERLLPRFKDLTLEFKVSIVPILDSHRSIEVSLSLVRMALTRSISISFCRHSPLCCITDRQAQFLLDAGAFGSDNKMFGEDARFFSRPGQATIMGSPNKRPDIVRMDSRIKYDPRPYAECDDCRMHGLGLCRGGFFTAQDSA